MEDPYTPEPPFAYECADCENRIEVDEHEPDEELLICPECGGELINVSTPSRE